MKCSICGKKIEQTFLNKIVGTMMKVEGKKYQICSGCQKKFKTKEEILKNVKN
jgi:ribosome-binding protein aMBF1 (putative translation factor)